ncbi:hypothetical protein MMC13_007280 [Lambiella insularis]|nr:hypothetical protein [Lambiella insularis]
MPFEEVGADTFLAVAPSHNSLWTCEPEAVLQISRSKDEFSKPAKALSVLNVYGPTVTATDGEESRLYRRIVGPSFNDKTHAAVWNSSIKQVERLLGLWEKNGKDDLVPRLGEDAARMTLYIMSKVCFGKTMSQMGDMNSPGKEVLYEQGQKYNGLAYSQALSEMLENILTIFLLPTALLS